MTDHAEAHAHPSALHTLSDHLGKRLVRLGGWAEGGYVNTCGSCGERFTGDKRAVRCLPCAIEGFAQSYTAAKARTLVQEKDET
jgi:hypothetical protein